ncbi:Imm1 family immunity protein [Streptomyces sp. NPDC005803]|uniref:Imm1 family immunity protein n=1 Tax=Streptomyces sp. NPDC005803 TaxID=3154297 RepID=UPI00340E4EB0
MHEQVEAYYRQEHAAERVKLTVDDVDSLIDTLLCGSDAENMAELHSLGRPLLASGFPDHEFLVGVDKKRSAGVLSFMDEGGNFVSCGRPEGQGDVVFYFVVDNGTEFPDGSEIPIGLVRQATKEFFTSGGLRPKCVEWQEPDW